MIRFLPLILLVTSVFACTHSDTNPDLALTLLGSYKTTQIKLQEEGQALEGGPFSASNGRIIITRDGTALDQIRFTLSYLVKGGAYSTVEHTETELTQLQALNNRLYFKPISSTASSSYLGFWLDQDGVITGSFLTKSFSATRH